VNTEATPQAIWPIGKSLINRDGPRAPTAIHGALGLVWQLPELKECFNNERRGRVLTSFMGGGGADTNSGPQLLLSCNKLMDGLPEFVIVQ
jgi:hypothetical protein